MPKTDISFSSALWDLFCSCSLRPSRRPVRLQQGQAYVFYEAELKIGKLGSKSRRARMLCFGEYSTNFVIGIASFSRRSNLALSWPFALRSSTFSDWECTIVSGQAPGSLGLEHCGAGTVAITTWS